MAAKRKVDETSKSHGQEPDQASAAKLARGPQEAQAGTHEAETASPARELQTHLEQRMGQDRRWVTDLGRALASASGITMILGVVLFHGIW